MSLNLTAVSIENLKVSVLKPDGTNLIVKTVGTSGGFGDPVKLPVGGTYKVFVDPQSSFYGSVTVGVYVVPADTTGTLVLGTPLTVSTTVPGQNATRTFNGTAGQRISFNFTGVTMAKVKVIVKAPGTSPPTVLQYTVETDSDFVDPVTLPRPYGRVHRDDRPARRIDGKRDADVLQRPRRRDRLDELREHRPRTELQAHPHGQTRGHAHVTVTTNVPAAAGQTQSVSLTSTRERRPRRRTRSASAPPDRRGNDFEVVFPANGTYTIVVDPFGAATGTTSVAIS